VLWVSKAKVNHSEKALSLTLSQRERGQFRDYSLSLWERARERA
jgi:hypothetical protein